MIVIAEDDDTYAPLAEPGARPAEGVTCPTCPSRCCMQPPVKHPLLLSGSICDPVLRDEGTCTGHNAHAMPAYILS